MTRERVLHWFYFSLYVGAIIIVSRLVFNSAWDDGIAWVDRIGLVVIAFASIAILKRINPDLRGLLSGKISAFADRKTSEISVNLLLTMLGIMASAIGLMAPRAASEKEPGFIESNVQFVLASVTRIDEGTRRIERKIDAQAPPADAVLQQKISGIWGEDNCNVTYSYSFADGGMIVASLKNLPGMEPSLWKGGNLSFKGGILTATTIENDHGLFDGGAVTFLYKSEAGVETLERNDKHEQVVTKFARC